MPELAGTNLVGKKLGVLLTVAPEHPSFRPALALMQAAMEAGVRVYFLVLEAFLTDAVLKIGAWRAAAVVLIAGVLHRFGYDMTAEEAAALGMFISSAAHYFASRVPSVVTVPAVTSATGIQLEATPLSRVK